METLTMGKVVVSARIENMGDVLQARDGSKRVGAIRSVEVSDALVDTGATMLSLPGHLIHQLGLSHMRSRTARTAAGMVSFGVFGTAQLTVNGRYCTIDVAEVPNDCPVLIGQVPLELMDWVVDPVGQRLIGNPDHGGEWMIDMF